MNEREASLEGLVFAGNTAEKWNKEEVAELVNEAKRIRKLGFRAVVVQSGVHEWGCGDKLLYIDKDYSDYKWLKEAYERADKSLIIEKAKKRCEEIMAKAEIEQKALNESVAHTRATLLANGHKGLEGLEG